MGDRTLTAFLIGATLVGFLIGALLATAAHVAVPTAARFASSPSELLT